MFIIYRLRYKFGTYIGATTRALDDRRRAHHIIAMYGRPDAIDVIAKTDDRKKLAEIERRHIALEGTLNTGKGGEGLLAREDVIFNQFCLYWHMLATNNGYHKRWTDFQTFVYACALADHYAKHGKEETKKFLWKLRSSDYDFPGKWERSADMERYKHSKPADSHRRYEELHKKYDKLLKDNEVDKAKMSSGTHKFFNEIWLPRSKSGDLQLEATKHQLRRLGCLKKPRRKPDEFYEELGSRLAAASQKRGIEWFENEGLPQSYRIINKEPTCDYREECKEIFLSTLKQRGLGNALQAIEEKERKAREARHQAYDQERREERRRATLRRKALVALSSILQSALGTRRHALSR